MYGRREGTGCNVPLVLPSLWQSCPTAATAAVLSSFTAVKPWGQLCCSLVWWCPVLAEAPSLLLPVAGPAIFAGSSDNLPSPLVFPACPCERVAPFLAAPLPLLLNLSQPPSALHFHLPPSTAARVRSSVVAGKRTRIEGHHWANFCLSWFLPQRKNPAGYQRDAE